MVSVKEDSAAPRRTGVICWLLQRSTERLKLLALCVRWFPSRAAVCLSVVRPCSVVLLKASPNGSLISRVWKRPLVTAALPPPSQQLPVPRADVALRGSDW